MPAKGAKQIISDCRIQQVNKTSFISSTLKVDWWMDKRIIQSSTVSELTYSVWNSPPEIHCKVFLACVDIVGIYNKPGQPR